MMTLTDTQRDILTAAAQHPDHLAYPPGRLPTGACRSVAKAMLRQSLVIAAEGTAFDAAAVWTVEGASVWLKITQQGLDALEPPAQEPMTAPTPLSATDAPAGPSAGDTVVDAASCRQSLRGAVTTLLTAWDACPAQDTTGDLISRAVEALRAAIQPRQSRPPRTLLRRPNGATIAQIMEATGWQQHTVCRFLAGLKKKGHHVEVVERIRQAGPNKTGSRGSYSIYRIARVG